MLGFIHSRDTERVVNSENCHVIYTTPALGDTFYIGKGKQEEDIIEKGKCLRDYGSPESLNVKSVRGSDCTVAPDKNNKYKTHKTLHDFRHLPIVHANGF